MSEDSKALIHKIISKLSDDYYHKNGFEADLVLMNDDQIKRLELENDHLRELMGDLGHRLPKHSAQGLIVVSHDEEDIRVISFDEIGEDEEE